LRRTTKTNPPAIAADAKLSANLLPLTVSERIAHAGLTTLRRADQTGGKSIEL
jgi:hypothetical protein